MRRALRVVLAGLLGACGGDEIVIDGDLGRPTPATIAASVPLIQGSVDGADGRLLVDSGAPLTLIDTEQFGDPAGRRRVVLDAFGVSFPDLPVAAFELLASTEIDGIVGGDLLRGLALSVDYRQPRVWLAEEGAPLPDQVDPAQLEPRRPVDASLRGGGLFAIPDCDACGEIEVGATRLLVEVTLESSVTALFLVDTGATAVVIEPSLLEQLGDGGRSRLDGVTVGTASGPKQASYVRLGSVVVGDSRDTSVAALVFPEPGFLDPLEAEIGREVAGLLGGSFLRGYLTTLDYAGRSLWLARYRDRDHIDADEFVGVGFSMVSDGAVWEVQDVYPETDAFDEGLVSGDVISGLDGESVAGASRATVDAILDRFDLADEISVELDRAGTPVTVLVTVEDLLPLYETP